MSKQCMRASVNDAKKNPGKTYGFDFDFIPDKCLLNNDLAGFIGKAYFKGDYFYRSGDIYVKGIIKYRIIYPCDRCGVNTEYEGKIDFDEVFYPSAKNDGDYVYSGDEIDFLKAVNDSIILDMPYGIICNEYCKGLCSICGKNLNKGDCGCERQDKDNPFGILKSINKQN